MVGVWIIVVVAVAALAAALWYARRKTIDRIVLGNLRRRRERFEGTRHVFFCFVDHFEPLWAGADRDTGIARVEAWHQKYPALVDRFRDNGGRPPRHNFFYPEEEYIPECLDMLADLNRRDFGDVEIHLHHDGDTSEGLRQKLLSFKETLRDRHGLLHDDPQTGAPVYAFIHGNWALDNSGLDGRWCGVNDELIVLRETGCYADFTYPSAPHRTQPPATNRIYYATDDPHEPRSHFRGTDAAYGKHTPGDLLMVNGPLTLNWARRKRGIFPSIENGDITGSYPATQDRVDLWIRTAVAVRGWPNWVFVKIHTHGTQEANSAYLLSDRGASMYEHLLRRYNDGERYVVHFSTPWEIYRCVKALERGDQTEIRDIEKFTM
jgi:hypothetical protein